MSAPWTGPWLRAPVASLGHRGWIVSWKVKQLLPGGAIQAELDEADDELDGPTVGRIAREMHDLLESYRVESCAGRWADDAGLADISDQFHTIGFVDRDNADAAEFDQILDALYDWADNARVVIA